MPDYDMGAAACLARAERTKDIDQMKEDIKELKLRTDSLLTIVALLLDGDLLTSSDPRVTLLRDTLREHKKEMQCLKQDS